jgi:hypothetical protein
LQMRPELVPLSTLNMIRLSCRTSVPLRSALSLSSASPHRSVNPYHFISHSHTP